MIFPAVYLCCETVTESDFTPFCNLSGILGCIREGIIYECYFKNADRYLETLFYVLIQTCAVWAAAAFMFSHLSATILLFGGKTPSNRTQKIWIPIYNAVFVILPLVFFGVTLVSPFRLVHGSGPQY